MSAELHDAALSALPVGTRFGELEILGTLGVGGFGIVYLARDHALEREVAIKEYMPGQFAARDGASQVVVRSPAMQETFALGLASFVNEARLLARFDHPSLLKVYRFWEANGTAYMAMPRLSGQNLRQARTAQPTPPPEAWVRRVFDAVLDGLAVLHAQQVWHRDIAPDNIFLPADGSPPILLDFGAARQAIGDRTQLFTAILKPRFAPIEQYAEAANLRQGPWTDFYALAAVMHELLTGHPPPPATARAMGDDLQPLQLPGYSPAFLAGLHWALRVAPHQRPASVAAWREVVDGRAPVPSAQAAAPRAEAPTPAIPAPAGRPQRLDIEFADTLQFLPSELDALPAEPAPSPRAARPARSARSARLLLAAAAVLGVLMLWVFARQVRRPAAEAPLAAVEAASAASSPAVAEAASSTVAGPAEGASAASVASAPSVAPAMASAASVPAARREPRREPRPIITEKAGEFRPVSGSPTLSPNDPPPASAPGARNAAGSAAAASPEPRTAAEACGGRTLFARAWCIDRQCEKPQFQTDPECVKLREIRSSRSRDNGP
ncbi:serine/threonine protein kinase [Roseateles sp. BYS87W]|uniref:non-specific serine/threonine protein kinase n=1 Tax=Pelomonas baiyunensis TaxID=3299026 RepID=A0ABW7H599_9BURK